MVSPGQTAAATSNTINFQARLETSAGAIVPDGTYNVEFKLYSVATLGSAEWTEDYTYNSGPGSTDARLRVVNGYLTANLGSITAFPGTINWNQQQWLTMNIGGTVSSGTITWDGEMSPRLQLTAVPYAFQAGTLSTTDGSGNTGTLSFGTVTNNPVITLPNASGTVCLQSSSACGFATGSGAAFLQGGNSFGAQGVLGTNDSNSLAIRTAGTNRLVIDTSGNLQLQQASTFNIASAAGGSQLTIQAGANSTAAGTGGTLLLQGGAPGTTGASGSVIVKANTNDSTTAFQVQSAGGGNLLNADTVNLAFSFNGAQNGAVGAFTTSPNDIPAAAYQDASVAANGYIYSLGGSDSSLTQSASVYYAKLNADGTTGTWQTNANSLPAALRAAHAAYYNGYLYYLGGINSGSSVNTVYYAKQNMDGSTGSWNATAALPNTVGDMGVVVSGGYIYSVGSRDTPYTNVYYAKINADGTISSWTSGTSLPAGRWSQLSVAENGYLYSIGGYDGTGAQQSTVYYAPLNADGSIGTWNTTISLPVVMNYVMGGAMDGYVYVVGGNGPGAVAVNTIYYAKLNKDGTLGSWATNATTLPQVNDSPAIDMVNGYIYAVGGGVWSTAAYNTVSYASAARVSVDGSLDLLGSTSGGQLAGQSASGGSIYAGNIFSNGKLTVQGNTALQNGLTVSGTTTLSGTVALQNTAGATVLGVNDTTTTVNLATNGDFETYHGTTGWATVGTGTTIAQTSTYAWQGNGSMKVTTTATANAGVKYAYTFSNIAYSFSFYLRADSGSLNDINIGWYDTTSNTCDTGDGSGTYWTLVTCTNFTPSAATGYIWIEKSGTSAETFYIDGFQLQTGALASAFDTGGRIQLNSLINSPVSLQNASDSTTAFQVQDASGDSVFAVDTANRQLVLQDTYGDGGSGAIASTSHGELLFDARYACGNAGSAQFKDGFNIILTVGDSCGLDSIFQEGVGVAGTLSLGETGSSSVNGVLKFLNSTNAKAVTIQTGVTSSSYTLTLPTAVGSTGQCLQTSNGSGSLTWVSCGNSVNLQASAPGAAQTGNFNISGTGIAGTFQAGTAGATTGSLVLANASNSNLVTFQSGTTSTSYSIQLPTSGGSANQCLQLGGSGGSQLQWGACGTGVTGLTKNAADSSSASISASSFLYSFTNSNTSASGGVLSLSNGSNTGPTLQASGSGSGVLEVQNASNVNILSVDAGNLRVNIGAGATGEATPSLLVLDSETGSATDPTEVNGALYYNVTDNAFRCGENGVWRSCLGGLVNASTAASSAVSSTTTLTNFSGGTNTSYTVLANDCQAGVTYLITASGTWTATSTTPTLTLYLDEDGTTTNLLTMPSAQALATASTTAGWQLTAQMICDSATAVEVQGTAIVGRNAGSTTVAENLLNTGTLAWTTSSHTLSIGVKFSSTTGSPSATMRQFIVQRLGP